MHFSGQFGGALFFKGGQRKHFKITHQLRICSASMKCFCVELKPYTDTLFKPWGTVSNGGSETTDLSHKMQATQVLEEKIVPQRWAARPRWTRTSDSPPFRELFLWCQKKGVSSLPFLSLIFFFLFSPWYKLLFRWVQNSLLSSESLNAYKQYLSVQLQSPYVVFKQSSPLHRSFKLKLFVWMFKLDTVQMLWIEDAHIMASTSCIKFFFFFG